MNVGLSTIANSPYVSGHPKTGKASDIQPWIIDQGIPEYNLIVPPAMSNIKLPNIIKQGYSSVCKQMEGGTNLAINIGMDTNITVKEYRAYSTLEDIGHAIELIRKVNQTRRYQNICGDSEIFWGETDPEHIVEEFRSKC